MLCRTRSVRGWVAVPEIRTHSSHQTLTPHRLLTSDGEHHLLLVESLPVDVDVVTEPPQSVVQHIHLGVQYGALVNAQWELN